MRYLRVAAGILDISIINFRNNNMTGLRDYDVNRDHFEAESARDFRFPCSACLHRFKPETQYPCRACDHNLNAEKDNGARNE